MTSRKDLINLLKKSVIIILSSLLFINLFLLFPNQNTSANETIKVNVDILNVRSGPSLGYEVIGKVYQDEEYPFLAEKNDWVKIKVEGKEGWIAGWFVEKTNQSSVTPSTKSLESNVTDLNVRKGPSLSFSVIDQIQPNTKYPVLEMEGEWVKIQLNSDKDGWVANWLVNISDDAPSKETLEKDFVTVNVDILNVRTGPSTSFSKIGTVTMNQKLEVMDINEGWYKVKYDDSNGWIAGEYASKIATENQNGDTTNNQNDNQEDKQSENQVVVNVDILNLRDGPGLDNKIIGKLMKDDILVVHDSSDDWLKVSLKASPSTIGWVADWFVVKDDSIVSNKPTVTILNPGTNLREGPSTSHKVVGTGNVGDQFTIIGTEGDWYHIQRPDDSKAYVAGWIVATKGLNQEEISHGIEKILKDKVIVVDAGHGGRDYGTTGKHFYSLEKTLNYKVAALLQKKLEAAGAKVILSRPTDMKISLQDRVDISANYRADAFISIHHNSNYNPYVNGTITYYYDSKDRNLASYIQSSLIQNTKLKNLGTSYGNYHVLRENSRVAVLVELAFLSNYQDELKARSSTFQEKEAEGIFQGLIRYFEKN